MRGVGVGGARAVRGEGERRNGGRKRGGERWGWGGRNKKKRRFSREETQEEFESVLFSKRRRELGQSTRFCIALFRVTYDLNDAGTGETHTASPIWEKFKECYPGTLCVFMMNLIDKISCK